MNRFLRYSLENKKKIRAVLIEGDSAMKHINLMVTALDEHTFSYISAKRKSAVTLPVTSLLAAGYARGDKGGSD